MNTLYYGDNLKILRDYIKDESVDLVYLDPPFNSNRNYNVLFKDESGTEAESQITAFEDTWHWNASAEETYRELQLAGDEVSTMIESFRSFIGSNQMMAYLVMMAVRLKELHRVLKPTGSLYLHCDPTASHYLKILLDTIFDFQNFRSEIIWRRTNAHNKLSKQFGPIHDTIFFYSKSDRFPFHPGRTPYTKSYVKNSFPSSDGKGRFQSNVLTGSGTRTGDSGKPWRNYDPTPKGRHWAIPAKLTDELDTEFQHLSTQDILELLDARKLILHPVNEGSLPRYKQYLDTSEGVLYQDIWSYQPGTENVLEGTSDGIDADVKWLDADAEKLGYPTQKPVGLLERMIESSSNEGEIVLDPFCGCGTTIAAAQKLNRKWIGIDITHLSIALQKYRLKDSFNLVEKKDYTVIGEPEDLEGAKQLKDDDRYQFQWWALSLIKARPLGGNTTDKTGKKGADKGIDGTMVFADESGGKTKRVIVSVKSGHVNVAHIRDLAHVVDREKAAIGIYLTLEPPTKPMIEEAVGAGFYHSDGWNKDYPKIQILTVEDLLAGKTIQLPPNLQTFKQAEKMTAENIDQGSLGFE